jgi:hypothetical protein
LNLQHEFSMNKDLIEQIAANVRRRVGVEAADTADAESSTAPPAPVEYYAPWTGAAFDSSFDSPPPTHPSQQQFNILEATDTVRELVDFLEAQRCTIEKDKPCDHCGACRTLGF